MPTRSPLRRLPLALALLAATGLLAAGGETQAAGNAGGPEGPVDLRLGYFPNLTHATAIVGLNKGFFATALGSNVTLTTQTFNAGPAAVEAIFGGALDAAYIGPNPAVNAFAKSHGNLVRVVARATSGGAALVVRPGARTHPPPPLPGQKRADPPLGQPPDL